jgi:TBC1 domain family member 20
VWPLLLNVDPAQCDPVPKLEELKSHPEYNQVVLDVNRSLKRFPPGIPLQQRLALQDQLTVIILRVISKYPHLSYYQVIYFIF